MSDFYIKKIEIKNFRNFENISFQTREKNVIIGMNDVGKTNLLYAIKLVFSYKFRNIDLLDSDFHKQNISKPFEIFISMQIFDKEKEEKSDFTEIILSEIGNLRNKENGEQNLLNIKLVGEYQNGISMFWNVSEKMTKDDMDEIPAVGASKNRIDSIFEIFDIPPYNDIEKKFLEISRKIVNNMEISETEKEKYTEIENLQNTLKENIEELDSVKKIDEEITNSLKKFNVSYEIKVATTLGLKRIYDDLKIFTKQDNEDRIYPTAGDGRKKTIQYAMYLYEIEQQHKKIPIILLEEPENHLFLRNQISLSNTFFNSDFFCNIFLSTHSPQLLYKISNGVNIIRIDKKNNQATSNSSVYTLPEEYNSLKNILQKDLSEALFCKKVLLVEGYSEKILFEYILDKKIKDIERRAEIYILNIIGVGFKSYYDFLKKLNIDVRLKTDNDLKNTQINIEISGIKRIAEILGVKVENKFIEFLKDKKINNKKDKSISEKKNRIDITREVYNFAKKIGIISEFEEQKCYLSEVDFENDLAKVVLTNTEEQNKMITFLQRSKWAHLFEEKYYKQIFSEESIEKIVESEYFKCIKDLINDERE